MAPSTRSPVPAPPPGDPVPAPPSRAGRGAQGLLLAQAPTDDRSAGTTDPTAPAGRVPAGASGAYGQTPQERLNNELYVHAMRGRDAGILDALRKGADLHDKEDNALRSAAGAGRLSTVALLLDQGADPAARAHHALRLAAQAGHREVVQLLLDRTEGLTDPAWIQGPFPVDLATDAPVPVREAARRAFHETIVLAVVNGRATTVGAILDHAQRHGIELPLAALEHADRAEPNNPGPAVKHAAARKALAPALQRARIAHERRVLHAAVQADRSTQVFTQGPVQGRPAPMGDAGDAEPAGPGAVRRRL